MKLSSKELKRQARNTLTGNYGLPMAAFVKIQLIVMILNLPFGLRLESNPDTMQIVIFILASMIISLIAAVLNCGLIYIHLNLSNKKEAKLSDTLFFLNHRPDRIILANLVITGLIFLTSLPAILFTVNAFLTDTSFAYILMAVIWIITMIPVTIISFSYYLVQYLLIENQDEPILSVLQKSRRLMSGKKGAAFYISLSFIGMTCLSLFSLGIGYLWVNPYIVQTKVKFYQYILKNTNNGPQI